ncbi:hypothetical protein ASPZODRAFT_128424 [Penicilliopsis zonata CBS 506.65]|uniref:SUI1 domain-containing protein n=1 Tax=Penicilliopsis zonata CBS 506.65 TaxID=1073090 RepID=A0A1L9SRM5_9EURO|nr:hypothetical protein ASPZODRAFT_128424 [Penicilliopsis zonata CBS 506.65]OJJ49870.1 hypothetical protein ASPZODRAFT_128424 [Penicilliopsis zonata CBS 506.65]
MFKKKPTIKNLSPLRSSDRRKIADQIISDYNIKIPAAAPAEPSSEDPATPNPTPATTSPNLTSIRNALLPENSLSARFATTVGPQLREVQGTVYVGTHAEGDERILWFKLEHGPGADGRLYPTVYTLWHNPHLLPLLYTPEMVMGKLRGGADLMTPGLANEPPFPDRAVRGAVAAVSSLDRPTVPLFVGICEIEVAALGDVQGTKGHAVRGVHWEGDELWAWSSSSRPGRPAPEYLQGWEEEVEEVGQAVGEMTLEETTEQPLEDLVLEDEVSEEQVETVEEIQEPSTKDIDDAFVKAFLYALYKLKQDNPSSPNHGLSLPVQPSALISSLITPYLPVFSPQQATFYQIKKTSWKNVKKFIKYLDKERLVKSKDRNGQETVILDVDFHDPRVEGFVPYRLPSQNAVQNAGKTVPSAAAAAAAPTDSDPSVGQTITVQSLYKPTARLVPTLFPALSSGDPNNYYKYSDVSNRLDQYISSQDPPLISPDNRRIISLNQFLANSVFTSSSADDKGTLARGKVTRDGLLKRITEDTTLLAPHYVILKTGQTLRDVKPKAGQAPKATVTLERRTGSKTVTKVTGLEIFGIIPTLLAEELQKKCASSTSVAQATGQARGVMEVLVQGDQRRAIESALVRRGVKGQWIDVVDKTKKKK